MAKPSSSSTESSAKPTGGSAESSASLDALKAYATAGDVELTVAAAGERRQITVRRPGGVVVAENDTLAAAADSALSLAGELWPEAVA
jgi:hypothetical protein